MQSQRGGFVLGLIVGLLIGLALALGVALYVTKVPVPFINKVPQRTSDQDAVETERNKTWDPNAPLAGRAAVRPAPAASTAAAAPAAAASRPAARDAAAILAGAATPGPAPASSPKSAKPGASPFIYYVQAGAFQRSEDAEQQRAKLGMLGLESKVVERDQSGRTVFRVRLGPFEKQAEADAAKERLAAGAVESVLVRVERPAQ
jgi:cell division protein FtsN